MFESYNFLILSLLVIVLYALSFYFTKTNKIKLITHKKIWNTILLFSFLVSGIIGLLLAFMIDQKMSITWYSNILWIHVEFGIIMGIVSIFHILWHIKYYINIKKKNIE